MKSDNFNRFKIDPEITTHIKEYINILIKQIKKSKNLNYVILNLDGDYVNDLTRSLLDETNIFYIVKLLSKKRWIDDRLDIEDEDRTNHRWSLCITGFKYGAKKDSPRHLGLFAYKIGNLKTTDSDIKKSTMKKKFKAIFFYDSYINEISNVKIIIESYSNLLVKDMNAYINDYKKYSIKYNYIKSKKKSSDIKKKSSDIKKKSSDPKKKSSKPEKSKSIENPKTLILSNIEIKSPKKSQGKKPKMKKLQVEKP